MDFKKIRKNLSYLAGWLGLNICSLAVKLIPARFIYGFADKVSALGYIFAGRQRRLALESLGLAFAGEKSPAEIERICRDSFRLMAKSAIELLFLMDNPGLLKSRVELTGEEYLERALAAGKGVILVSAHFGNFPLALACLSLEGHKTSGIMRPMRDARTEEIFLKKRQSCGVETIYSQPRNVCVDSTIRALRNNELVFIPVDQNFGTAGVFVDFFGRKAATATGPVIFAQRTGAALLPCFIVRQPDNRHKLIFEPALKLEQGKDSRETVVINIQKITCIIEAYIRRYPAEWGWIHRRWKSKPS
ncbi:MAG: lysophospholipid acyltransferase family protein [Candidatus Omnitrophota bacterium]|nr:lysophospholipid acyltransferase family protein [Candidatus Omnitrophota bacterium]